MRLRREESRMSAKGYVFMEEKNKSHGPTEEELSDSVKDAYTSVYVLDPMADGFDDEDDFTVEIVGAPSDGENDGKNADVTESSAEKTDTDALNGDETEKLSGTAGKAGVPEEPSAEGTFPGTEEKEPEAASRQTEGREYGENESETPFTEEKSAEAAENVMQENGQEGSSETAASGSYEANSSEEEVSGSSETGAAKDMKAADASEAAGTPIQEPTDESDSVEEEEEEEQPKKKGKAGMIIGLVLFLAVISAGTVAYIHFRNHFAEHFYPGTVINGTDISEMTIGDAKNAMQEMVDTYTLTISEKDNKEETIDAKSIALTYVDDGRLDDILEKQNAKTWFLFPFKKHIYSLKTATRYTEEKLNREIDGLSCLDELVVVKPQDAKLVVEGSTCTIAPEVEGTEVDKDKLVKAVTDAVDTNETEIDIVQDDCYVHPEIYRDDEGLKARMDQWNVFLSCNINYWFGENVEVINADSLRDNIVDDGTSVTVPYEYIRKLVYGWGQKYDTFGLDRQFTTHSGETITVVNEGEGDYGWCSDKDKTIADVTEAINSGFQGDRNVIWLYEAMGWDNGDLTGTYVEVSLSEQKLWCYQDYNLVMETDVVTGTNTPERETKRGIYAIDAKKEHATLGTLDVQGYASPVDYWAPFNGGQGLHDAPWRSSFGGSIYQYNGSHGCVNIPPANMKTIFDAVSIGTAVVVY